MYLKCFIICRMYSLFDLPSGRKIVMPSLWNLSAKASNSAVGGSVHDVVDDTRMLIKLTVIIMALKITGVPTAFD